MTETSAVRGVNAASRAAGSTSPLPSTGRKVTSTPCSRCRARQVASTAGCSVSWVMTWADPRIAGAARTAPRMASASASEPLPVNTISSGRAGPEVAARLAADHAYIDALRRREEPVDARLEPDATWLSDIHQSNLERARHLSG